jgi:AraC-like DNA-binding protein
MATPIEWTPRGVLHAPSMMGPQGPGRFRPEAPLDLYVEHFWSVAWDLRGQSPVTRETLPHPSIHVILEEGRSGVSGIHAGRFSRTLEGEGRVFGIKFLPGCFRPFFDRPLSVIANRVISLQEAFGAAGPALETAVLACGEDAAAAANQAESFFLSRLPRHDPQAQQARRIVARILDTPSLTRAEVVAADAGMSLRALQRLFNDYVGASPKWVIQRYRLHEALLQLDAGARLDLAALALELGYFDQAHFNRDFKALVGQSPGAYAVGGES